MAQALDSLPAPNLKMVSTADLELMESRIDQYCENCDLDGLAGMAEEYPLPAVTLDGLKTDLGIEFLLKNKFNLTKAVEAYGIGWIG